MQQQILDLLQSLDISYATFSVSSFDNYKYKNCLNNLPSTGNYLIVTFEQSSQAYGDIQPTYAHINTDWLLELVANFKPDLSIKDYKVLKAKVHTSALFSHAENPEIDEGYYGYIAPLITEFICQYIPLQNLLEVLI